MPSEKESSIDKFLNERSVFCFALLLLFTGGKNKVDLLVISRLSSPSSGLIAPFVSTGTVRVRDEELLASV